MLRLMPAKNSRKNSPHKLHPFSTSSAMRQAALPRQSSRSDKAGATRSRTRCLCLRGAALAQGSGRLGLALPQPQPKAALQCLRAVAVRPVCASAAGAHAEAFIAEHVGYEEYMALARQWDVDKAAIVCGVEGDVIRTVAYWMVIAKTLVIVPSNGLERGRNGGSGIRTAIALPALMGKLNQQSGIVLGARGAFPRTPDRLTRPDLIPAGTRTININDVGRHLERDDLDPPLRALFIYNHNPIVVHPDQNRMKRGLAREEIFLVGINVTMTETMQHCDVVLPAATHFEIHDLYPAYGHHWLHRAERVIAPVGKSLPNTEIFRKPAARFGFDDHCFKTSDLELMDEGHTNRQTDAWRGTETQRKGPSARLPSFRTRETAFPLSLVSPASDKRVSHLVCSAQVAGLPKHLLCSCIRLMPIPGHYRGRAK